MFAAARISTFEPTKVAVRAGVVGSKGSTLNFFTCWIGAKSIVLRRFTAQQSGGGASVCESRRLKSPAKAGSEASQGPFHPDSTDGDRVARR
jgi:hypothetical protein